MIFSLNGNITGNVYTPADKVTVKHVIYTIYKADIRLNVWFNCFSSEHWFVIVNIKSKNLNTHKKKITVFTIFETLIFIKNLSVRKAVQTWIYKCMIFLNVSRWREVFNKKYFLFLLIFCIICNEQWKYNTLLSVNIGVFYIT